MRIFAIITILCVCVSCNKSQQKETPIVKVFDHTLYAKDLQGIFPNNISEQDSILITEKYIRKWVTQQLLLEKARKNISIKETNIEKLVNEYRNTLIIHTYKEGMINQYLQDNIQTSEIEQYYKEHNETFVLAEDIAKAIYIVIPNTASKINELESWLKAGTQEDIDKIENYCLTNAKQYEIFNNKFVTLRSILTQSPITNDYYSKNKSKEGYLKYKTESNIYYLRILDSYKRGEYSPIEFVYDKITLILKNKKKILFEDQLEEDINNEAIDKGYVTIY